MPSCQISLSIQVSILVFRRELLNSVLIQSFHNSFVLPLICFEREFVEQDIVMGFMVWPLFYNHFHPQTKVSPLVYHFCNYFLLKILINVLFLLVLHILFIDVVNVVNVVFVVYLV